MALTDKDRREALRRFVPHDADPRDVPPDEELEQRLVAARAQEISERQAERDRAAMLRPEALLARIEALEAARAGGGR